MALRGQKINKMNYCLITIFNLNKLLKNNNVFVSEKKSLNFLKNKTLC